MPLTREMLLNAVVDGKKNLDFAGACSYLHVSQETLYALVKDLRLHPVRIKGALVFARSDLNSYRVGRMELELTKAFMDGEHPLDVFYRADARYPLREVNRVLREWARLTGVWIIEAPRGSYARWLSRMGIERISPRNLRRLVEALLTDNALAERARAHLVDRRLLNGLGATQKEVRAQLREKGYRPPAPELDAADQPTG